MRTSLICLLVMGIILNIYSYPISPRPLRKLIMESDVIITGHVKGIHEKKAKKDDYMGGSEAEIVIYEVLQGKLTETTVFLPFNPYMVCPAPPHFTKDTDVLVFLSGKNNALTVHALSYGVKQLNSEEMEIYKSRIKEMQKILKMEDKDEQFIHTTEWLVKCAENECTRYEGTYELRPGSNFMSFYDRTDNPPYEFSLNADQKLRIKKALLNDSGSSYVDFGLVDLVYPGNEEEIFDLLFNRISHLESNQYWYADEYMKRLCYYKTSPLLQALIVKYDDRKFSDKDEQLKALIGQFVSEMKKL